MSYQKHWKKWQLPAKCLPKYPSKWAPQAPASCPAPCPPPAPTCCVPSCCISGFGGHCSLVSLRFPRFYLRQPQHSDCCEHESSRCSTCHSSGDCS
ncbi:late cornified envelope protein 7A [Pongo pygmaeus]|uniref:late cornified envelope protein 7A n=1 Tax=Pongo pygmaeus TaxID=9600 RepID=UPI0023E330F6|nr:late cornified envelope protein 7A [Pongo pygmaeus]